MKTSNILLTVAAVIFLTTLVAFDLRLKGKYLEMKKLGLGKYHRLNRFNDYDEVKIKQFTELNLQSANTLNVKIEYGEKQAVWVRKRSKERVAVSQNGDILSIDLNKIKDTTDRDWSDIVIISPTLRKIRTTAFKFSKTRGRYYEEFVTMIEGFRKDSLTIIVGASTKVSLNRNRIKSLNSSVGDNTGDAKLSIESNNDIEALKLDVKGKSNVEVLDNEVNHIEHNIADSAIVTFRGKTLEKL
ncbi:MAG: hypothetical protein H7Y13_14630 [Sphingobacteriaceae bacterium]|nr:hypothetical protein [Sphingobacteriaceae bacterium]